MKNWVSIDHNVMGIYDMNFRLSGMFLVLSYRSYHYQVIEMIEIRC